MPLATVVLCMEFPPTTSSGSHMDNVGEHFSKKDGDKTALISSHACM